MVSFTGLGFGRTNMNKKYYVLEVLKTGEVRLMIKQLIRRQAEDTMRQLTNRYPDRQFKIEIREK